MVGLKNPTKDEMNFCRSDSQPVVCGQLQKFVDTYSYQFNSIQNFKLGLLEVEETLQSQRLPTPQPQLVCELEWYFTN
jgi:hypothetical protein